MALKERDVTPVAVVIADVLTGADDAEVCAGVEGKANGPGQKSWTVASPPPTASSSWKTAGSTSTALALTGPDQPRLAVADVGIDSRWS